jgi:hypothetical protein
VTITAEPAADSSAGHTAAALTGALLTAGWTYTREVRTEPQWRSEIHELDSPDRRLHVAASRFPDGSMIARLTAQAARTDPAPTPGWSADLHQIPLPAALSVIEAAAAPTAPENVASTLAAHGWTQREDVTEADGRLLERAWDSPDATHTASWFPPDEFDLGGWMITRPGSNGRAADSHASQFTPAAVLTALALAD